MKMVHFDQDIKNMMKLQRSIQQQEAVMSHKEACYHETL